MHCLFLTLEFLTFDQFFCVLNCLQTKTHAVTSLERAHYIE